MELDRREFAALVLGAAASVSVAGPAGAQTDPLLSWNDGPAKNAILAFVRATTVASSPDFVPPPERIATFDQDGTLWVEHPMYTQVIYCFDRVPEVAKARGRERKARACRGRAVQDRALGESRGHRQTLDGRSPQDRHRRIVSCETARRWTYAKKALSFAMVTNDGDDEGTFFLGRLPWKAGAEAIRYHCGIPKKRELSEQELERLRAAGREHGFTPRRPSQIAA